MRLIDIVKIDICDVYVLIWRVFVCRSAFPSSGVTFGFAFAENGMWAPIVAKSSAKFFALILSFPDPFFAVEVYSHRKPTVSSLIDCRCRRLSRYAYPIIISSTGVMKYLLILHWRMRRRRAESESRTACFIVFGLHSTYSVAFRAVTCWCSLCFIRNSDTIHSSTCIDCNTLLLHSVHHARHFCSSQKNSHIYS